MIMLIKFIKTCDAVGCDASNSAGHKEKANRRAPRGLPVLCQWLSVLQFKCPAKHKAHDEKKSTLEGVM